MRQAENWTVWAKKADFQEIGKKYGIDQVTARIMRNRDIITDEEINNYLNGTMDMLPSPYLLKDVKKAAGILAEKIKSGKKICIIGDYDIDGVQSSYILWEGIENLGGNVYVTIPDRIKDGYGVNEQLVEAAIEEGADTILTCDNGIAGADALKRAKENGLTVIVTDHHEIPFCEENGERKEILPDADAIVNPKQKDCTYPFKEICGAVVAWHLIRVLYDMTGKSMEQADVFIENAAFATIGDVMELQHENRILVKEGLKRLNQTKSIGMRSLIASNKLDLGGIKAYHIGFVLGPCLNASGRLDTAKKALLLLKTKDEVDAGKLAEELVELNTNRKSLTEKGIEDAMQCIETQGLSEDRVLVIYLPDCHESIAGIIAGRVRERYHRPVYVLTNAKEGVKGSGRSIEGYSMYEELCKCQDLLDKFGGHPMAAGCSMQRENVDIFRKRLNDRCTLTKKDLQPKIRIDVPMTLEYLSEKLIHEFSVLEPFGKGNEKPVFADKELRVRDIRIVGTNRKFVRMKLVDKKNRSYPAICFDGDAYENQKYLEEHKENLSIVYYPQINTFFGEAQIEVLITHFR